LLSLSRGSPSPQGEEAFAQHVRLADGVMRGKLHSAPRYR
jgi:hypothetical protein